MDTLRRMMSLLVSLKLKKMQEDSSI